MSSRNAAGVSGNLVAESATEPRGGNGRGQAGHFALLSNLSIGHRISGMAGVLLLLLLLIGGFGAFNIRSIGIETGEVANRDIPLAEAITAIETKQLEQAVIFERTARLGASLATSDNAAESFSEHRAEFEALSVEVKELILKGQGMAREAISEAPADERGEFELILTELEEVQTSFASYEGEAQSLLGIVGSGRSAGMAAAMERVEARESSLIGAFEATREQLKKFSRAALQDAVALARKTLLLVVILSVVSIFVGVLAAVVIIRGIVGPITGINRAMSALSQGDLATDIQGLERGDEIGAMAKSVEVFKKNAVERQQLMAAAEEAEHAAKQEREEFLGKLAGDFETATTAVLSEVTSAADQVKSSATAMSATADQTNHQSTAVAAASEEASSNVQTVASASEELASSISEISRQVEQSTNLATKAVEEAEAANKTVQGLAASASSIGDVVELINNIAAQTNLLALNATIEAARAGEAGKGFAVVASEVKSLASQTARATEEISGQVATIQQESSGTVAAIDGIRKVISEVNEIAGSIAVAVEEQGAATQEIARNVQQAASGTQEVSSNITGVTQAAGETGQAAAQVLELSNTLSQQADQLRGNVEKFLADLKSA